MVAQTGSINMFVNASEGNKFLTFLIILPNQTCLYGEKILRNIEIKNLFYLKA